MHAVPRRAVFSVKANLALHSFHYHIRNLTRTPFFLPSFLGMFSLKQLNVASLCCLLGNAC